MSRTVLISMLGLMGGAGSIAQSTFDARVLKVKQDAHVFVDANGAADAGFMVKALIHNLFFTEAAERVLNEYGHKSPMHYREITAKALQQGWIATSGKTPQASMYSQLITEIRRDKNRGKLPRFVQHGQGFFGLSRWMGRGLAFEIEQHNKWVRLKLHAQLLKMDPGEFEDLIGRLLAELGFEGVEVTRRSQDGGIDVRGTLVVGDVIRRQMVVPVKRWKSKNHVQAPVVQQVRGSLGTHEQGLIITTSEFSIGAKREAERPNAVPVALMNGEKLVGLPAEYQVGIKRQAHDLFEIEEDAETDADPLPKLWTKLVPYLSLTRP